ncbi:unnamed protein product [Anisakis simplex]|uniref:Pkinase_Tyr domain-containing protein n=1 Tax=Anisakis simplex TaxID=6269 RepID=A0A0M3JH26_ANISI|nr:unnamed protein product [Anisakis simplex]
MNVLLKVAVKCVSSEKLLANPSNFLQEAAIMHKMRHECVVRLFGVVLDTKTVMLVRFAMYTLMIIHLSLTYYPKKFSPISLTILICFSQSLKYDFL